MLNTGSFLLRRSEWSKRFLARVWGAEAGAVWLRRFGRLWFEGRNVGSFFWFIYCCFYFCFCFLKDFWSFLLWKIDMEDLKGWETFYQGQWVSMDFQPSTICHDTSPPQGQASWLNNTSIETLEWGTSSILLLIQLWLFIKCSTLLHCSRAKASTWFGGILGKRCLLQSPPGFCLDQAPLATWLPKLFCKSHVQWSTKQATNQNIGKSISQNQ